jgi:hypothetical protein
MLLQRLRSGATHAEDAAHLVGGARRDFPWAAGWLLRSGYRREASSCPVHDFESSGDQRDARTVSRVAR